MRIFRLAIVGILGVVIIGSADPASGEEDISAAEAALGTISAIVWAGTVVYDIATAPGSARRYNDRALGFAPWIDPRSRSVGVSVRVSLGGPARPAPRRASAVSSEVGSSSRRTKSPRIALALSLGATAAPVAALSVTPWAIYPAMAGLVFGPSAGHWYSGQHRRAWATSAIRIGSLAAMALAFRDLDFD